MLSRNKSCALKSHNQFFTNRCNMKRNILLLIFFLIETAVVVAGTGRYTVSGRVLDEHDLKPLPYATVKVLNLELWAITDEGGAFTLAMVNEIGRAHV